MKVCCQEGINNDDTHLEMACTTSETYAYIEETETCTLTINTLDPSGEIHSMASDDSLEASMCCMVGIASENYNL